jgi:hypothetical protein
MPPVMQAESKTEQKTTMGSEGLKFCKVAMEKKTIGVKP